MSWPCFFPQKISYCWVGQVYQVEPWSSCIPSEFCLTYSHRSIHSKDRSVGSTLDSPVHTFIPFPWVRLTDNHTIPSVQETCLTSTTFWDAIPTYWFADADAINIICSDKSTYLKDVKDEQVGHRSLTDQEVLSNMFVRSSALSKENSLLRGIWK